MTLKNHRTLIKLMFILAGATTLTANDFDLSWYTIDGGGGNSAGGDFELAGTIGQPDASLAMTGGDFSLAGGFWAGGQLAEPIQPGDCDGDGNVDFVDFTAFAACLSGPNDGLGVDCACFDFDGDGDNDLADFAAFQAAFTGP
jgi:hypothetical protein